MNQFWKAVLLTALIAGTLDIIAAHVHQTIVSGEFPTKMFYGIAAGAIGLDRALNGGLPVFVFGVLIHYFISFSFTLFFFLLYPISRKVSSNKYINGVLYALFVWLTMAFIVLPLSALPQKPFVYHIQHVIGFLILIAVFGLPISLFIDRYYQSQMVENNGSTIST